MWGVVAYRQFRPLPMGVGEVVVVWRSKGDRRGWVRGLTHTRSPVIHRWCMGLIVSRRFVWEQSLLSQLQEQCSRMVMITGYSSRWKNVVLRR